MGCLKIRKYNYDVCDGNIGGIRKIWLADYVENMAQVVADDVTGNTAGTITGWTQSGITWTVYKFHKNTATMTSTLNVSDNGVSSNVTTELQLSFSKMNADKRAAINALCLSEAMAVVEDMNGTKFFLGELAPITVSAGAGETGQQMSDLNQYSLTLFDTNAHFPRIVSAVIKDDELPEE